MKIVNVRDVAESFSESPARRYARGNRDISIALGREPASLDLSKRLPFDVQLCRIPPGRSRCPYHQHTAQTEYFQVLEGTGSVRHAGGRSPIRPGDCFHCLPGEAHQLTNDGTADLLLLIVADNPLGDAAYYPDSRKWMVQVPDGPIVREEPVDYFAGEE